MFQLFSGVWLFVVTSPARSGALFHGLSALGQLLFLGRRSEKLGLQLLVLVRGLKISG